MFFVAADSLRNVEVAQGSVGYVAAKDIVGQGMLVATQNFALG